MVSASMIYLIVKQSRAVDRRKVRAALQDLER
jgi:hypothetical protein